jgi:hypothetical protein
MEYNVKVCVMSDGSNCENAHVIVRIASDLDQVRDDVQTTRQIVTGNGHPEDGLVVKTAKIEQAVSVISARLAWLVGIGTTVVAAILIDLALRVMQS